MSRCLSDSDYYDNFLADPVEIFSIQQIDIHQDSHFSET